jgi:uncharacterized membrane protein YsdA (DUF1294 family)
MFIWVPSHAAFRLTGNSASLFALLGAWYLLASAATFLVYAADKSAAARGTQRTPESSLHLFSLVGGWPGALLAQQFLRHKSSKQEFRRMFWAVASLNCVALVVLASPAARKVLGVL